MSRLKATALATHGALAISTAGTIATAASGWPIRAAWLVIALLPLAAATPGLAVGRHYTRQWLALVLVAYVGGGIVEVLAATSRLGFATFMLLAAGLELALLLALIRRGLREPRGSAAP